MAVPGVGLSEARGLEMFLGLGTAIVAGVMGRHCHGMEIEPEGCEVAMCRWQNLTGEEARPLREES